MEWRRSIGRWPSIGRHGRSRKLIVALFVEGTHNNECDGNPIEREGGRESRRAGRTLRHRRLFDTWRNEIADTPTDRQTEMNGGEGGEGVVGEMQKGVRGERAEVEDKQCGRRRLGRCCPLLSFVS